MAQTLIGYGFFTTNYIEFHVSYFFEVGIFWGHVIPTTNNLTFFWRLLIATPSSEN
jgi:hypothetical protein